MPNETNKTPIASGRDLLPIVRQLEDSEDGQRSHRGAIGQHQIMPGTARAYGFDPRKLNDPAYNEQVAGAVLDDLWKRYNGDPVAVLAAYNSGTSRTNKWIRDGRGDTLPQETLNYLERAKPFLTVDGAALPSPEKPGDPLPPGSPRPDPVGRTKYQELREAGFSAQDADKWKQDTTDQLLQAGFTPQEIDDYWGEGPPDTSELDRRVKNNIAQHARAAGAKIASSPLDMLAAGWDTSVQGLRMNQSLPHTVMPDNPSVLDRTLSGVGQVAGDFPSMVLGAGMGAPIGGAIAAVAGPEMIPVGATGGALFGAGALPVIEREIMLGMYQRGDAYTASDYFKLSASALWKGTKSGLINLAAGPLGGKVQQVAAPVVGDVAGTVANVATQAATMTTLDSAFAGRVPDAGDFASAAVLMLGLHTAGVVVNKVTSPRLKLNDAGVVLKENLEELYRQTGIPPWKAVSVARTDPVLMQELVARDPNNKPVFAKFRALMTEPDGYSPPPKTEMVRENVGISINSNWMLEGKWVGEPVVRQFSDGTILPDPEAVASYLKRFGELAGFSFQVGPPEMQQPSGTTQRTVPGPGFVSIRNSRGKISADARQVYIPDTPDALSRRWYGLGASEVIFHEVGHAIDQAWLGGEHLRNVDRKWSPALETEITQASKLFAKELWAKNPRYRQMHPSERFADAIAAWISNPTIRKIMPEFSKEYGEKLQPYVEAAERALPRRTASGWERAADEQAEMGGGGGTGQPPGGRGGPPGPPGGPEIIPPGRGPRKVDPGHMFDEATLNELASEFIGEGRMPDSSLDPKEVYRQLVSELGPAREIDKMLADQGFDAARQVGLEDAFRQTYASDARTGHVIFRGGLRLGDNRIEASGAPSVVDAVTLAKANGGGLKGWVNYMIAERALTKMQQGKETGHPLTADQLTRLVEMGRGKYAEATISLQRTFDSVLEYGRDSGVFSQEQIDAMRRDNPVYISFRRLMGNEETLAPPRGGRRGFRVREPVARFEGDDRRIQNPMIAAIDNMSQIIRMSDRNRAIGAAVTLAEQHGLTNGIGFKRLTRQEAPAPYATMAEPGSNTFRPYDVQDPGTYEPFLAVRASRYGGFRDNQFMFLRDGKFEVWEAKEPALAQLMRGSDSPASAFFIVDWAQKLAAFQRAGIVSAPDFPLRNTLRDQITTYILDKNSPPPFLTWMRGAFEVFKAGDHYWDWVANGGAGMALVEMDRNILVRDMHRIFEDTGTWDSMWNVVRHPLEASQILSAKIDEGSRVGYHMAAKDLEFSPLKAATLSRKAYLDFVERGTNAFVQTWARATPFFRPNILGLKQTGEALAEKPGSVVTKAIAAITIPAVALYALNYWQDQYLPESEKYANLPRYWKDGMYILPQVGGVRLRIPYPPVVGAVFGALPVRFLDAWVQKDPAAFEEWSKYFLAQVIPPFIPSIALPAIEQYANTSWFSGHKLIPARLEHASGPMQYTENTTEVAKVVAQATAKIGADVSPIVLENYVRQWAGSMGYVALKALNAPLKTSGKPWEIEDVPFIGSFMIRNPGMSAKPIQEFFDERDKYVTAATDKREALRHAMVGADNAAELDTALSKALDTSLVENVAQTLTMQTSIIQAINNDKTMQREEKLQAIDNIYNNAIVVAKYGLQAARDNRKALGQ